MTRLPLGIIIITFYLRARTLSRAKPQAVHRGGLMYQQLRHTIAPGTVQPLASDSCSSVSATSTLTEADESAAAALFQACMPTQTAQQGNVGSDAPQKSDGAEITEVCDVQNESCTALTPELRGVAIPESGSWGPGARILPEQLPSTNEGMVTLVQGAIPHGDADHVATIVNVNWDGENHPPKHAMLPIEGCSRVEAQSSAIALCPVGDEPRLRAQLSRCRAQLHAAQLQLQRSSAELTAKTRRLDESEKQRLTQQRISEDRLAVNQLNAAHGTCNLDEVRGALCQLADARLSQLEAAIESKDEQLRQVRRLNAFPMPAKDALFL